MKSFRGRVDPEVVVLGDRVHLVPLHVDKLCVKEMQSVSIT